MLRTPLFEGRDRFFIFDILSIFTPYVPAKSGHFRMDPDAEVTRAYFVPESEEYYLERRLSNWLQRNGMENELYVNDEVPSREFVFRDLSLPSLVSQLKKKGIYLFHKNSSGFNHDSTFLIIEDFMVSVSKMDFEDTYDEGDEFAEGCGPEADCYLPGISIIDGTHPSFNEDAVFDISDLLSMLSEYKRKFPEYYADAEKRYLRSGGTSESLLTLFRTPLRESRLKPRGRK